MNDDSSLWQWLSEAFFGPGRLRFLLQPVIAVTLGIRDGRRDARAGRLPYLWGLVFQKQDRRMRLKEGVRAAAVPLVVAVIMDAILQYYTLGRVRLGWALVVGAFLVLLPYSAARALTNRFVSFRAARSSRDSLLHQRR